MSFSDRWQKPRAIIVDMDGTLVNVSSIRHYVVDIPVDEEGVKKRQKDFDSFHKASLFCPANWDVVDKVQWYWEARIDVLIVTARNRDYEKTTRDWLHKYAIPHNKLFMRDVGDYRPDVDVKRDILAEIEETWRVVHAIDDNPNVIALWEEKGIPVTLVPGWDN